MNNSHQDSLFAWIRILRQENVFLPAFWQIHLEQCLLSQVGPQRIHVSKFFTMQNQNYAFSVLNLLFLSKQKKGSFKSLFPFIYFESLKNTNQSVVVVWLLSHAQLSANPWTIAHQAPLSMGFFRQEHWSGLPFPSPTNQSGHTEFQCHLSWPAKSRPFKVRDTDIRTDMCGHRAGRGEWGDGIAMYTLPCVK